MPHRHPEKKFCFWRSHKMPSLHTTSKMMKVLMRLFGIAIGLFFVFPTGSCARKPPQPIIDTTKFDGVYRSAKATEAAANVGVTYAKLGELIQNFATEISIAKDRTANSQEVHLVSAYAEGMQIYQDSMVLWKAHIDERDASSGLTYSGETAAVAKKYQLPPIKSVVYEKTLVIPEDSMKYLWFLAADKLGQANSIFSGKPQVALQPDETQRLLENLYAPYKLAIENHRESEEKAKLAAIRAKENARLEEIRQAAEEKHLLETEDQRLDPKMEVLYIPGEPYYHFDFGCNRLTKTPRGITLQEARSKLRRCPDCRTPRPKKVS
jgi:hypothetical protein